MKEIGEDTNKQEDIPCSRLEKLILLKCSYYPKQSRFNIILIKIAMALFTEIRKTILIFVWNHERPQRATAILRKKNKGRGITLSDFKLYYKAIEIRTL